MILRKWLVVQRHHGEAEPVGRFFWRFIARAAARHINKQADSDVLYTVERLTAACAVSPVNDDVHNFVFRKCLECGKDILVNWHENRSLIESPGSCKDHS